MSLAARKKIVKEFVDGHLSVEGVFRQTLYLCADEHIFEEKSTEQVRQLINDVADWAKPCVVHKPLSEIFNLPKTYSGTATTADYDEIVELLKFCFKNNIPVGIKIDKEQIMQTLIFEDITKEQKDAIMLAEPRKMNLCFNLLF